MKVDAAMKTENLWHNLWQDRRIVWISWCLRLVESTSDVPPLLQLHWRWPLQGRSIVNLFQFTFQWKYLSTFLHSLVIYLIVESSCNRKQNLWFWHTTLTAGTELRLQSVSIYSIIFYRFRPDFNILNHAFIESRSTWFNSIYYLLPTSLVM